MRFYCCGPTVYGPAHIGNFRTFLIQDTLRRVLEVDGMDTSSFPEAADYLQRLRQRDSYEAISPQERMAETAGSE